MGAPQCRPCARRLLLALPLIFWTGACSRSPQQTVLTADMPLHLEDHLHAATFSEMSATDLPKTNLPKPVEWRFDQPQPDWKPARFPGPNQTVPAVTRITDALRVTLSEGPRRPDGTTHGGVIYVDLPGWRREEWAHIIVRARTPNVTSMAIGLNVPADATQGSIARTGGTTPVVSDGSVQTYQIRPNWGGTRIGPWQRVGLGFRASEPGSIDILSVSVVPIATLYAQERVGLRSIAVAGTDYRRTVFSTTPGRLEYAVRVPDGAQLSLALGVLQDTPVDFTIEARPTNGETRTVFRETYADPERWADRTVDLSSFAGQTVALALETRTNGSGTVAFWGSPTLSGTRRTDKPNVILYVIDGGGADFMSLYEYNRRTTPNLEKLAAEGAVFERAYSNSSWTKPSTASFMTSLQNSVLGFTGGDFDPLPEQALTMAQRFHQAGYQTAVFTANPNAATNSGLQRGADVLQESEVQRDATSSVKLHQAFWNWRAANPGQPYWAHIQTTDVHAITGGSELNLRPGVPVPPFAGLFVSPADVIALRAWSALVAAGGGGGGSKAFESGAVDRDSYLALLQGMYDQQMAHNDYQLGRLIDRLKASGEWRNTLLLVTADHSLDGFFGTDMTERLEVVPPAWTWSTLRSTVSRVPLVAAWPGHIAGGQRFADPVSLIDLLPTLLDLASLPPPAVTQGVSLASRLRGEPGWTPRPVIMDEIVTFGGRSRHIMSVIDGRWGASKKFGEPLRHPAYRSQPWPVLLFDLWTDPLGVAPVNEAHPDLVKKYTTFLEDTWKDHQLLAKQFTPGAKVALTPEQLERLRALGYIR